MPTPRHRATPKSSPSGQIRIGNQTSFAAASPLEPFAYALANGFDAFEWFPDKKPWGAGWDESDLSAGVRSYIRLAAQASDMRLSVHARWTINPLAWPQDHLLLHDIELAWDLGAALFNIHLHREAGMRAFAEAIRAPLQWATACGLQLAIENTPETNPQDFNTLFAELDQLDWPERANVGMCLDVGHANLCSATRNDYLAYLDQLAPHVPIIHLHLHENWGDADSHLPLFTGPSAHNPVGILELLTRLRQRHYSGSLILEQWPDPPSLLNQARSRLQQIFQETDPPTLHSGDAYGSSN